MLSSMSPISPSKSSVQDSHPTVATDPAAAIASSTSIPTNSSATYGEPQPLSSPGIASSPRTTTIAASSSSKRLSSSTGEGLRTAQQYYDGLRRFLESHLEKGQSISSQRQSARDKLSRLSKQQFQELATDVYDETTRRVFAQAGPGSAANVHIPPTTKDSYHPKRNQARQKLATLSKGRFHDLAADVYFELEKRFPILLEKSSSSRRNSAAISSSDGRISTGYSPRSRAPDRKGSQAIDGLMRDLGSMGPGSCMSKRSSVVISGGPTSESERLEVLEQKVDLERAASVRASTDLTLMLSKSNKMEEALNVQKNINTKLEQSLEALRQDHKRVSEELKKQHRKTEAGIDQADALREELRRVKEENEELAKLRADNAKKDEEISRLTRKTREMEAEVKRLSISASTERSNDTISASQRKKYSSESPSAPLKEQRRPAAVKTSPPTSQNPISPQPSPKIIDPDLLHKSVAHVFARENSSDLLVPCPNGGVEASRLTEYQAAVDSLSSATYSPQPIATDILLAMKSVVVACKTMTQQVDAYESLYPDQTVYLSPLKGNLSTALTVLMNEAKTQATKNEMITEEQRASLDEAASELTTAILEIIRIVRLRPNGAPLLRSTATGKEGASAAPHGSDKSLVKNLASQGPSKAYSVESFLESSTDQIVRAIHALLTLMKQSNTPETELQRSLHTLRQTVLTFVDAIAPSDKPRVKALLENMRSTVRRLDVQNAGEKRQDLATACFDVTKLTKSLVGILESDVAATAVRGGGARGNGMAVM